MDYCDLSDKLFCRICYQEASSAEDSTDNFIRPCKCMDHVHRSCLLKWANSSTSRYRADIVKNDCPNCEICCEPLYLRKGTKLVLRQKTDMKKSIKRMLGLFISGSLIILLCLLGIGFLAYLSVFLNCKFENQSSEIIIIAWIILPIFLTFWIYLLTANFLMKKIDYYTEICMNQSQIKDQAKQAKTFIINKMTFLRFLPIISIETFQGLNNYRKQ